MAEYKIIREYEYDRFTCYREAVWKVYKKRITLFLRREKWDYIRSATTKEVALDYIYQLETIYVVKAPSD